MLHELSLKKWWSFVVSHHLVPSFSSGFSHCCCLHETWKQWNKAFHKSGVLPRDNAVTKITEASQVFSWGWKMMTCQTMSSIPNDGLRDFDIDIRFYWRASKDFGFFHDHNLGKNEIFWIFEVKDSGRGSYQLLMVSMIKNPSMGQWMATALVPSSTSYMKVAQKAIPTKHPPSKKRERRKFVTIPCPKLCKAFWS